jgi:3-oxoisoapionate decarboxylase
MKLGISSFTYGWNVGIPESMPQNPTTELDLVKKTIDFGLNCLQIGDNLPIHTFSEERKVTFRKALKDNHLRFELGAKKLTTEHLQNYIDLAVFFEAPLLRFIIDGENYEPSAEEVVKIINKAIPHLEADKITLGIENHDRFKATELAEIMATINHPNVGICLDCVNSIGAGEGLEHVANALAPYTVNLHVKDFKAKRLPHKMGFVIDGEIAGKGMTNLPWLVEKILPYGRCQSAILEQWVPPENDIEDSCKKETNWAELGIEYVKQYFNK